MEIQESLRALAAGVLIAGAQAAGAEILIGQSAGFTGGQAEYSKDVRTGIQAYFEAVNRAGGVHGRPLKLIAEDDKGNRQQVLANTKKLIEQDKVFALIGYTSGAGVEGVLPLLQETTRADDVAGDRERRRSGWNTTATCSTAAPAMPTRCGAWWIRWRRSACSASPWSTSRTPP